MIAQKKDSAEELYKDLGYKVAIPEYEKNVKLSLKQMVHLSNSYRLNADTENAAFWYAQVIEKTKEPIHFLHYAQALQSNGEYKMAKQYFIQYNQLVGGETNDQRGELFAATMDRMNEFAHSEVEIKNESILNTNKLDFSPTHFNNGIIFVSTREAQSSKNPLKDIWINDNFMALFHAKKNEDGTLLPPKEFSYHLTTKYHEGPVSFNKTGDKIFFTRNNFNKGKRVNNSKGIMKLQIYTATKTNDDWSDPIELPWNTIEYEEAHPSLSADGQKLYFSSDRPGGLGGMDIYVSEFSGGQWQKPVNLGEEINTPGNEVFPFIHDDGTLYYASNGWGGLGGLDIFSTVMLTDSTWSKARNIGTPFNSRKDDFGFILNVLGTEGYLTSARDGGHGKDDIYSFKIPKLDKRKQLVNVTICAFEDTNNKKLSEVEISILEKEQGGEKTNLSNRYEMELVEADGKNEYLLKLKMGDNSMTANSEHVFTTDEKGQFKLHLPQGKEYYLLAKKDGYLIAEDAFNTKDGSLKMEFCIPLKISNCLSLKGVANNSKFNKAIPFAKVSIVNACTGEEISTKADAKGVFNFPCLECGCDYYLKGSKKNFKDGNNKTTTLGKDCNQSEVLVANLNLAPDLGELEEKIMAKTGGLKEGAVIELENIFYDFDKHNIRREASVDLDKVVILMRKYPSMIIELSSHTDARGTYKYNASLSQRRAESAVRYIVNQGVDNRRLVARGYGENMLRNRCADFVECTEEEHQRNRRTEIKILKLDEKVMVNYIDNAPEKIDRANPNRIYTWE